MSLLALLNPEAIKNVKVGYILAVIAWYKSISLNVDCLTVDYPGKVIVTTIADHAGNSLRYPRNPICHH